MFKNEALIEEAAEFGKYKAKFIKAILQHNSTALHKGAESRKIYNKATGEMEETLLWDSVLHHIDGNHDNNPFDFSNYTLIQSDSHSKAMLIHRLIHLLSFAENGNAAEAIKNKIRSYNAEFITLFNNKLNILDFDSWRNSVGNNILKYAKNKIAEIQPGEKIMTESLTSAKSIIADQLRGEWEAIQNYNKAINDLGEIDVANFSDVMDLLNDIADEEKVHCGELQKALATIDNTVEAKVEEGKEEAEEKLADDNTSVEVDEALSQTSLLDQKIAAIDKLISDIYDQRKQGLANGGEYGQQNLLFKEFRNRGYLDRLKELKNELVSKKLSLESLQNESLEGTIEADLADNRQPVEAAEPEIFQGPVDYKKEIAAEQCIDEGTEKIKDHKWVNKGKAGTHGTFTTKKAADAQRKAMYASGWKESLEADLSAFKNKQYDKLLDDGDPGSVKQQLIATINSKLPDLVQKSAQKYTVGENSYNKWAAVLHHINADRADNTENNIVLILDTTESSPKYAELVHKLIHLYAAAFEAPDVQTQLLQSLNKLDQYVKFIMLINNKVTEFSFKDWWQTFGKQLENYYTATGTDELVQTNDESVLNEQLDSQQMRKYREELSRISFNQAIVQENGLFNIYNVKENDIDRIIAQIRNLEYIDWVHKSAGNFDFSKAVMFGQLPPRYYTVTGQIKN